MNTPGSGARCGCTTAAMDCISAVAGGGAGMDERLARRVDLEAVEAGEVDVAGES